MSWNAPADMAAEALTPNSASHPNLVRDLVSTLAGAWDEQTKRTGSLAAMACRLAELGGVPPLAPIETDGIAARATEYVADLR